MAKAFENHSAKTKVPLNNLRWCFQYRIFEFGAVFKQANYMNFKLHDCYARKFINYEIYFGASFAILLCSEESFAILFSAKQTMNESRD